MFSFFEDTVRWIRVYLKREISNRPELAPYRDRIVTVSGSGTWTNIHAKKRFRDSRPSRCRRRLAGMPTSSIS